MLNKYLLNELMKKQFNTFLFFDKLLRTLALFPTYKIKTNLICYMIYEFCIFALFNIVA